MEDHERWKEQVRSLSEKTNNSYTAKDIERLIDSACELLQLMTRAGYTKTEKAYILGLGKEPYGKKERALLEAMINGRVKPTDSLATIKKKMDSTMVRSKQSWAIAFNRLIENGDLG